MQWAPTRLARPRAIGIALLVTTLGIILCPAAAHAQVAGYCSELAASDVAPAPMVPSSPDLLVPGDCPSREYTEVGSPIPWEEVPAAPDYQHTERGWPTRPTWPVRCSAERTPIEATRPPCAPDHRSGVFRPPR